jgi:hypothetical protein
MVLRDIIGTASVIVGAAVLAAVNHHPTTGRHTAREVAAIQAAGDRLTHSQIVAAWTQTKLGNSGPLHDVERTFPLVARTIQEEGPAVVFTFAGHDRTCIDFISRTDRGIAQARHC